MRCFTRCFMRCFTWCFTQCFTHYGASQGASRSESRGASHSTVHHRVHHVVLLTAAVLLPTFVPTQPLSSFSHVTVIHKSYYSLKAQESVSIWPRDSFPLPLHWTGWVLLRKSTGLWTGSIVSGKDKQLPTYANLVSESWRYLGEFLIKISRFQRGN